MQYVIKKSKATGELWVFAVVNGEHRSLGQVAAPIQDASEAPTTGHDVPRGPQPARQAAPKAPRPRRRRSVYDVSVNAIREIGGLVREGGAPERIMGVGFIAVVALAAPLGVALSAIIAARTIA